MDPPATPSPTVAQQQHPLALKVMRLSRPALAEQRSALYVDGSPRWESATPPLPQTLVALQRAYDPAMNVMAVKRMDSASVATLNAKHVPAPRAMDLLTGDGDDGLSEELAGVSIAPGATLAATPTMDMRDYALSSLLTLPAAFGNIYLGETFVAYLSVGPSGPLADPLVRNVSFKVELQTTALRFALYDSDAHAASATSSHALEFTVRHEIKELGTHILVCQVQYMHGDEQRSFRKFYKVAVVCVCVCVLLRYFE